MKKTLFRNARDGRGGLVTPADHGSLQVLEEDCQAQLHAAGELKGALHHFLPVGCSVTLKCHGTDKFKGGEKDLVVSGGKVHSVMSMGDYWLPLFDVPKKQAKKTQESGTAKEAEPQTT